MSNTCPLCGNNRPEGSLFCNSCTKKVQSDYEVELPNEIADESDSNIQEKKLGEGELKRNDYTAIKSRKVESHTNVSNIQDPEELVEDRFSEDEYIDDESMNENSDLNRSEERRVGKSVDICGGWMIRMKK